eukprot:1871335-Amphidinium_carterae.1
MDKIQTTWGLQEGVGSWLLERVPEDEGKHVEIRCRGIRERGQVLLLKQVDSRTGQRRRGTEWS